MTELIHLSDSSKFLIFFVISIIASFKTEIKSTTFYSYFFFLGSYCRSQICTWFDVKKQMIGEECINPIRN